MLDVGIEAEWQVMLGREEFYNATKRMHNALQGNPSDLTPEEVEVYERYNELNAKEVSGRLGRDHRARPAAGPHPPARAGEGGQVGLALPHRPLDAQPGVDRAPRAPPRASTTTAVFHMDQYVPAGLRNGTAIEIVPPAIDPLSPEEHGASRPRTPPTSATSSASTWTAR